MEIRGRDRRKENGLYHPVAGAAIAELGATAKILRNYRAAAAGSVAAVFVGPISHYAIFCLTILSHYANRAE
jgi:hypothetical protein